MRDLEGVADYLSACVARRAGRLASGQSEVDRPLDVSLDRLYTLVSQKLGEASSLQRCNREAAANGALKPRTKVRLQRDVEDAAKADHVFAAALRDSLAELRGAAFRPNIAGSDTKQATTQDPTSERAHQSPGYIDNSYRSARYPRTPYPSRLAPGGGYGSGPRYSSHGYASGPSGSEDHESGWNSVPRYRPDPSGYAPGPDAVSSGPSSYVSDPGGNDDQGASWDSASGYERGSYSSRYEPDSYASGQTAPESLGSDLYPGADRTEDFGGYAYEDPDGGRPAVGRTRSEPGYRGLERPQSAQFQSGRGTDSGRKRNLWGRKDRRGSHPSDDDWPGIDWGPLSDEEYWAELSTDEPPTRSRGPGPISPPIADSPQLAARPSPASTELPDLIERPAGAPPFNPRHDFPGSGPDQENPLPPDLGYQMPLDRRDSLRGRRGLPPLRHGADAFSAPAVSNPGALQPHERYLVAQMPTRVPQSAEVSLLIRVTASPPAQLVSASAPLAALEVGPDGTRVTIVVQAPSALTSLEALERTILVPAEGDSEPARFAFQATGAGLHRLLVTAWVGGTFLAELAVEISVQAGGPYVDGPARAAAMGAVSATPGEVTLQVRFDGKRYTFQLLSEPYMFEPVIAEAVTAQPSQAVERTIATLRSMASGSTRGGYSGGNARTWMEQAGVGLWNDMVPELIKDQFWRVRHYIASFSIAAGSDVIPWELIYPLAPNRDEGFLVEQFPVMRRVYGQQRARGIMLGDARYIVPSGSPSHAQAEIAKIRKILGPSIVEEEPIADLKVLLELIESGRCGLTHFACHNTFDMDKGGSAIIMDGGPFVPMLLNKAVTRQALAAHHPLVFINACRSAGAVPEYTQMMGWAQQFMAAGAGAFLGTLWAVRSESASTFAGAFYDALSGGRTLGEACHRARLQAARDVMDPTWLAYTAYGDPAAKSTAA